MSDERALAWTHLLPHDVAYQPVGGPEWWHEALRTRSCSSGQPVPVLWESFRPTRVDLSVAAGVVAINPSADVASILQSAGFRLMNRFAVLPGLHDARLYVPLASRSTAAAAFQLHVPYRLAVRAKLGVVHLAARMGVPIWKRDTILLARRSTSPVDEILARALPGQHVEVAISTGTPGAFRKITMQAIARNSGKTLAYLRLATTSLAREALHNEGARLDQLQSDPRLASHCPAKLAEWYDHSQLALVTTAGPPGRGPQAFGRAHLEFLQLLTKVSSNFGVFGESPFLRYSRSLLGGLEGQFPIEKLALIHSLLNRLEDAFGTQPLPFVTTHRDFVPWNTRTFPDGRLFVFDWEFSRPDWLPLADMFHFHVQPAVLSGQDQDSLWHRFRRNWIKNAEKLGISESLVLPLFAAYLVDTILFYMSARAQDPSTGDDRVWIRLLSQVSLILPLLEHGGRG